MSKREKSISKTMVFILLTLLLIQGLRLGLTKLAFLFIPYSHFADSMVTAGIFFLFTLLMAAAVRRFELPIPIFPNFSKTRDIWLYASFTTIAFTLMVTAPILSDSVSAEHYLFILYSSLITPAFEELLFRGFLWEWLSSRVRRSWVVLLLTSLLFGLWHLGYIDTVILRAPEGNILFTMAMKALIGFGYGILTGLARISTKNCYAAILLHGVLNVFGR